MKYILVDTAGNSANVIARKDDKVLFATLPNERRHSDVLLGEIDGLLRQLSIKVTDLDYMGVITGPGSFTGIRIGIATIKGFAAVNNCKLIGLTAFDVLKEEIKNGVGLLKCTKTSCYYAIYRASDIEKTGVVENDEISSFGKNIFVVDGDGLEFPNTKVIKDYKRLLQLAMENAIKNRKFVDNNQLEAVYMQKPQAERELEK